MNDIPSFSQLLVQFTKGTGQIPFWMARSTACRFAEAREEARRLVESILQVNRKYSRYGYRRIRALLVREGGNRDFVHDHTDDGNALKMLTLIDEYSRHCLKIEVSRKLKSDDVLNALAEVIPQRGLPKYLRSDNGSEFIAREVQGWFQELGAGTTYIDPGSPWQNGHIKSFRNRLRHKCLKQEVFLSMNEARVGIEKGRTWKSSSEPNVQTGPERVVRSVTSKKASLCPSGSSM